ncbi:MAG TPA: DUF5668 domain-containing protein [Thermoanaerobaculia bacterium]|nr:DUF5668 domain-containing protein [Thermoanaerobaculia bacterium]
MNDSSNAGPRPAGELPPRRANRSGAATGILLIVVGAALLLAQLRMLSLAPLGHWWPVLLIGFGMLRLFGGPRQRWSGYWILVTGIYGAIGEWGPFGLTWADAWPIFIIAAGVGILGRSGPRPWFTPDTPRRPN